VDENLTITVLREAVWLIIKLSFPILLLALVIGVVISLLQALTQIQEQTLTFVPKMLAVFLLMMYMMPFILNSLGDFATYLFGLIASKEGLVSGL
jgi:flagellar biosynthetic protein FliQ